jgi:hypothetical protein
MSCRSVESEKKKEARIEEQPLMHIESQESPCRRNRSKPNFTKRRQTVVPSLSPPVFFFLAANE